MPNAATRLLRHVERSFRGSGERRFAAFAFETASVIPDRVTDLSPYMPFGISCAGLAFEDRQEVVIWQDVPRIDKDGCKKIVAHLQQVVDNGYTLVSWAGCSYYFESLAEESGLTEQCAKLALEHVDLMMLLNFTTGQRVTLNEALDGADLPRTLAGVQLSDGSLVTDMNGLKVPKLWDRGEYRAVLEYLKSELAQLLALVRSISTEKEIRWVSRSGRRFSIPMSEFPSAKACFEIPEPDVSWMDDSLPRQAFVEWMPDWKRRIPLSAPTRRAFPVAELMPRLDLDAPQWGVLFYCLDALNSKPNQMIC